MSARFDFPSAEKITAFCYQHPLLVETKDSVAIKKVVTAMARFFHNQSETKGAIEVGVATVLSGGASLVKPKYIAKFDQLYTFFCQILLDLVQAPPSC